MKELRRHSNTIKAMLVITVFIVAMIVLACRIKVNGREISYNDSSVKAAEKEYVSTIRDILQDEGLRTAGVSLTKVIDPENGVVYTLSVHHKLIDNMDVERRERLENRLDSVVLPVRNEGLNVVFI